MGIVLGFLEILAGIGMLVLGGLMVLAGIFTGPEVHGYVAGAILCIGGLIAFIGFILVVTGSDEIIKRKKVTTLTQTLKNFSKMELLFLASYVSQRNDHDPNGGLDGNLATISNIHKYFVLNCKEHGEKPVNEMQMKNYTHRLEDSGIIYQEVTSYYGVSRSQFNSKYSVEELDTALTRNGIVPISRLSLETDVKIRAAGRALKELDYVAENVSAKEFDDYMSGLAFSFIADDIELMSGRGKRVLANEFLMIHELVEMSELKKMGRTINMQTIMKSPKTMIYEAHFTAMEYELNYALLKKNYSWIEKRLEDYNRVLDDPRLPEKLKPRYKAILERFKKLLRESTEQAQ